ncbi:MAG: response regulator [Nitrospinae bacterium]|nr:response regulator [Nitrospinota bacterium]
MAEKPKVLLVDDSLIIQKVGKQILFRKGFNVILADHGEMALKLFPNQNIKLVILDYHMPKMNGLQAVKKIRSSVNPEDAKTPILILTGESNPTELNKLLEAGANDYLNKGRLLKNPEIFLEKVYHLLNEEGEVAKYKKIKLSKTLSPFVKDFLKFTQLVIDNFMASGSISQSEMEEIGEKLENAYTLFSSGEYVGVIYEVIEGDDYLPVHTVNTTLLMLMFGVSLKWEKNKLIEASLGAFFHDFGCLLLHIPVLVNPKALPQKDYADYMKHVEEGSSLGKTLGLPANAQKFIENHHERLNGSGFPKQKKGEQLDDISQVAGIITLFDSLTSQYGIHNKMHVSDAINKISSWNTLFSEELLKKFDNFSRQFDLKPDE